MGEELLCGRGDDHGVGKALHHQDRQANLVGPVAHFLHRFKEFNDPPSTAQGDAERVSHGDLDFLPVAGESVQSSALAKGELWPDAVCQLKDPLKEPIHQREIMCL